MRASPPRASRLKSGPARLVLEFVGAPLFRRRIFGTFWGIWGFGISCRRGSIHPMSLGARDAKANSAPVPAQEVVAVSWTPNY